MSEFAVAITGASGAPYGLTLVRALAARGHTVHVIVSEGGARVLRHECDLSVNPKQPDPAVLAPEHADRVLPHAVAKRPIHNLMLLDAILVAKLRTDNNGFEMLAVPNHFNVIASEAFLDIRLDGLGRKHLFGNGVASGAQLVATSNQQQSRA